MGKRAGQAFADFCHNTARTAFSKFQRRHEIRTLVQGCVECATLVMKSCFFYYGSEPVFAMDMWAAAALGMLGHEKGRACAALEFSPLERKKHESLRICRERRFTRTFDKTKTQKTAYHRLYENAKKTKRSI